MTKYNKTLHAVIAIGLLLGSQTAKADPHNTRRDMLAPIENSSNEPIQIRVAYIGEYHPWYGGCTLCPDWHNIQPHSTFTIPSEGGKFVTNIEIFDKDGKKSFGWTNNLSKDDISKVVFDGKLQVEKDGKLTNNLHIN